MRGNSTPPLSGRWHDRQGSREGRARRKAANTRLARLIDGLQALERWNATVLDNGRTDHLTIGPARDGPYYLVDDVTRLVREAEASKETR